MMAAAPAPCLVRVDALWTASGGGRWSICSYSQAPMLRAPDSKRGAIHDMVNYPGRGDLPHARRTGARANVVRRHFRGSASPPPLQNRHAQSPPIELVVDLAATAKDVAPTPAQRHVNGRITRAKGLAA